MESKRKPRQHYNNKQSHKPKTKSTMDIDDLVAFKHLKDEGNELAIRAWNEYQQSNNEKKFHENVAEIVKNSKSQYSDVESRKVPEVIDEDIKIATSITSHLVQETDDKIYDVEVSVISDSGVAQPNHSPEISTGHENVTKGNKSKALLSFLKASPQPLLQPAHPNVTKHKEDVSTELNEKLESMTVECPPHLDSPSLAPSSQAKDTVPLDSVTTPIVSSSIEIQNKNETLVSDAKTTDIPAQNPVVNRSQQIRTTRNQVGNLSFPSNRDETLVIRPNQAMTLYWELPQSVANRQGQGADYRIVLTRYGSSVNLPGIVAKSIGRISSNNGSGMMDESQSVARGKVPFFSPRSAGRFVYRLIDHTTIETARVTLATSESYYVELDEPNLDYSLKFVLELFEDKKDKNSTLKAVSQFGVMIKGINAMSLGRGQRFEQRFLTIVTLVDHLIDALVNFGNILDEALSVSNESKISVSLPSGQQGDPPAPSVVDGVGIARKVHLEAFNVFQSIRSNESLWRGLPPDLRIKISNIFSAYCPLLQRFFKSQLARFEARKLTFGFSPSEPNVAISSEVRHYINQSIKVMLPSILPNQDFDSQREEIRRRMERYLAACDDLPFGTTVALFGSSKNNFGSNSADVDMCIVLPNGCNSLGTTAEDRGKIMEIIGNHLINFGMQNVEIISTARIPVVNFKDPQTGHDCDITYFNPLAIYNTLLLRSYSAIDPRVRLLAYVVKSWAKARHLNSPGDGTLSSYGFILCIIHFLQRQSPPIVPVLQQLPSSWNGTATTEQIQIRYEKNVVDGSLSNVHFHQPSSISLPILQQISYANKDTPADLLFKFFEYFAWKFDFNNHVVSISSPLSRSNSKDYILKVDKAEKDGWIQHERLSIEDPFETWYDVAHVIKGAQMKYMRQEFLRAYTLLARAMQPSTVSNDQLPQVDSLSQLLSVICVEAAPPAFTALVKDLKKKRADSELEESFAVDSFA